MQPIDIIPLDAIRSAARSLEGLALRTPLVRLGVADAAADIYLKLENLQPIGSFKLRGAGNAMANAKPGTLDNGVYTASAGNMAQGLAWVAKERQIPCSVVVPEHAPRNKLEAIERLGAKIVKLSFDEWWQVLVQHGYPGMPGKFIHPVCDPLVIAGNASIGLEILEDLPDVDTVVVPFGGGGLCSGIASAFRALKPDTRVFAAEVATAAPLSASFAAGKPTSVDYEASFVDGIGGKSVFPEMWPMLEELLAGSLVVSLEQVATALRTMLTRNCVLAEGAGAAPVAAALAGLAGQGRVVCVVSGGNIDASVLVSLLEGRLV